MTDRIIRPREVRQMLGGIGKSTLWRWVNSGDFPRPIRLGERAVGWKMSTVEEWIRSCPAA